MKKYIVGMMLFCICMLGVTSVSTGEQPQQLVLGFLPAFSYAETMSRAKPLREYLEKELGIPVSIIFSQDMDEYLQNAREGRVDIFYLNPPLYLKLAPKKGVRPDGVQVVGRTVNLQGTEKFRGVIVCRADRSDIQGIGDLTKGLKGMCTAKNSAAGFTSQKFLLASKGIDIDKLDIKVAPSQKHEEVLMAVYNREVDFGMYREDTADLMKDKVDLSQIKIVAFGDWIPEWCFCVRSGLDSGLQVKVRDAFFKLSGGDPQAHEVLKALKINSVVPARDEDWNEYRASCEKTGYEY